MNEFETLDENLSNDEGFSPEIKATSATIAQWVKIIAIIGIVSQVIDFGVKAVATGGQGIAGSLIAVGIVIGLYSTLYKFGQSMTEFSSNANKASFSSAMSRQRIYWQFLGIVMIILIVIFALVFAAYGDQILNNLDLLL